MSLPHALLGLLAVEPRSGYELTKAFSGYVGRYAWQAGHTGIYPELGKLAERGLVEVTEEGARGSRTYSVTPEGHAELRTWMITPPNRGKVRNEQVLRLFLISALDPADGLALLHDMAEHAAAELEQLRRTVQEQRAKAQPGVIRPGLFAAEFGVRQYEAIHEWALWAIDEMRGHADPDPT